MPAAVLFSILVGVALIRVRDKERLMQPLAVFCDALRNAGAEVTDAVVVFFYDIFPEARERLAEHGLALHYLATWRDVLKVAREGDYFDANTLQEVESFLNDPLAWSGVLGCKSELSG